MVVTPSKMSAAVRMIFEGWEKNDFNLLPVRFTLSVIGFSPVSKYSTGAEGTYNKVKFFNNMNGFNGYAYKFYTQIAKTTDRPYTAMLFINYLSTAEGIANYQEGNGVYSTNNTVQQDIDSLLNGFVMENYADVKSDWASIVKLLEGYN